MLDKESFTNLLQEPEGSRNDRDAALQALRALGEYIQDLERELVGIGHNHPPEPIDNYGLDRKAFIEAREDVRTIETELSKETPNKQKISVTSSRLVQFGISLAQWSGERFTRFTDAALKVAAPILIAKISGLMPLIVSAVEAVVKAISP